MPASIWLQPAGEAQRRLRDLITVLASKHGTVPFEPHLTVCRADRIDRDAAVDYVRCCGLLPFTLRKRDISFSTVRPFKAVVIEIENTPELARFRETLRRMAGAPEFEPPHISLLYTIGEDSRRVTWSEHASRLGAIAAECEKQIGDATFLLDRPVVVEPDGGWTNIKSWTVVRQL